MTLQKATGTSPETPAVTTNNALDFTGTAEVVKRFLAALDPSPEAVFNIEAYSPKDKRKGRTIGEYVNEQWQGLSQAAVLNLIPELAKLNAKDAGIYIAVNEFNGKRNKDNLVRVRCVHADFDKTSAPEDLKAASAILPPTQVVQSSPNRFHAYWRLLEGEELSGEQVEALNRQLVTMHGADKAAIDCTRLLRLPGFNHTKGFNQCNTPEVLLLDEGAGAGYTAEELASAFQPVKKKQQKTPPTSNQPVSAIAPETITSITHAVEKLRPEAWSGTKHQQPEVDESTVDFDILCHAVRVARAQSVPEEDLPAVVKDVFMRSGAAQFLSRKGKPDDYLNRSINNAIAQAGEDEHFDISGAPLIQNGESPWQARARIIGQIVNRYNARYFIATEGGRNFVYDEEFTDELNFGSLNRTLPAAFREIRQTKVGSLPTGSTGADGMLEYEYKPEVELWWKSPERRAYTGGLRLIPTGTCPPDVYNLWKGFGVEPTQGDSTSIMQFILAVVCNNNQQSFDYLMGWLAYGVQHPERQAEVAVVMRGGKGIGKGTLGKLMKRIYGSHALQITNVKHLTGNFNGHLRSTLLLFADEAFWAGDKAGESVLKGLVTEPTLTIEQKGVDLYTVPNRLKILMASNAEWVVPASGDERRFFILDVSDERQGDQDYWTSINRAINSDECVGAFLSCLQNYDLSNYNVRIPPNTKALDDQKISSLDPVNAILFEALSAGELGGQDWSMNEPFHYPCNSLKNIAVEYCKTHKRHSYDTPNNTSIGNEIKKTFGDIRKRGQSGLGGKRPWIYKFPPLDVAQDLFCRRHLLTVPPWEEADSE